MVRIIAGFLSGLIGSMGLGGGGVLLIYLTVFEAAAQLESQGINLLFFLPTGFLAVIIYAVKKKIKWKLVAKMWIGGVAGVLLGTVVANNISTTILQKIFAVLLIVYGLYTALLQKKNG